MLTWVSSHGRTCDLARERTPDRGLPRGLYNEVHTGEDDTREYTYYKVPRSHRHNNHDDLEDS